MILKFCMYTVYTLYMSSLSFGPSFLYRVRGTPIHIVLFILNTDIM